MALPDLELFDANPEWRLLLAAYEARHSAIETEWLSRLAAVEGLATEQLSMVHGKLIALGLLKFELGNRMEGVQYRVTPLGRQALLAPESRTFLAEWQLGEELETPVG